MSITEQERLRGEIWNAKQTIKRLRAELRKAHRRGKVLARGYYCGTNAAGHHMVCPVGHGCALEGRAALCRRVEVREVPKRRAGR